MSLLNPKVPKRGTPTLSLTGSSVCLCVSLLVLFQPLAAIAADKPVVDKKNRVETILSYGEVILSDRPLPDKVFERRRHTVQIAVIIHEKGKPDAIKAVSTGSGYIHRPGMVISSAHILQVLMYQYIKVAEAAQAKATSPPGETKPVTPTGEPKNNSDWKLLPSFDTAGEFHIIGEDELRASKLSHTQLRQKLDALNCEYSIFVRVFGRNTGMQVPLTMAAISNPESPKDIMALRVRNHADLVQRAQNPVDPLEAINPSAVLVHPAVTAQAELGETVYPTGFGGFQPFVEECYVSARPKSATQFPFDGLKEPYVLRCSPDFGFSGGPTLNAEGQVIGIAKQKTNNFALIISMKDIDDFLKIMDKAEKTPKKP